MGQVAEGEDETLKILAASSEFILTVSVLTNAVYSLRSYDADGIRWRVTGLVDRKRRVVYGLEIHPTKDPVGEMGGTRYRSIRMLKKRERELFKQRLNGRGIAIPGTRST